MRIILTRRDKALDLPDGINIFIFSLAEALIKLDHEVIVVGNFPWDEANLRSMFGLTRYPKMVYAGYRAREHRAHRGTLLWSRVLGRLKPDVVLLNGALPIRLPGWTCAVSHDLEHQGRGNPWIRRLYKIMAYRMVDQIVSTASELRRALSDEILVPTTRIRRIPTCINPALYPPTPYDRRDRAILHMGTVRYKNPEATIRAFSGLSDTSATLYITGDPDQIPPGLLSELPSGVRERIRLVGYVSADDLRTLLGKVMVVSVPSAYSVPVASPTAIESLAAGTPVVTSRSISSDVIVDGHNGFRVRVDDIPGLTRRFGEVMDDRSLWLRLADGCRESVKQFSAETVANSYVELISTRNSPKQQLASA